MRHLEMALALGWTGIEDCECVPGQKGCYRGFAPGKTIRWSVPRYDLHWDETGPVVEKYRIRLDPVRRGKWAAYRDKYIGEGETALDAVCALFASMAVVTPGAGARE